MVCSGAKKSSLCCMKSHRNDKIARFFCNDFISKLYKIKTIEVILKIQNSTGSLVYPLQFLFPMHCYKINSISIRDTDLKAVRGGESALAMAKKR